MRRSHTKPITQRLWLTWDEKRRDFYHRPSDTTLDRIKRQAETLGWTWRTHKPANAKHHWMWIELTDPGRSYRPRRG